MRRTYSAPTPFGPYILCAESEARSTFVASTSNGIFPIDWTASQWKSTPAARVIRAELLDRLDGPDSLFACITETRIVSLPQRRLEPLGVEAAVRSDVEEGDLEALPLERVHRVEHRLVLGLAA